MQPFQTWGLTRLEFVLLFCSFLTLWVGGMFNADPGCPTLWCKVSEAAILFLNISCMIFGLGNYVWFAFVESRGPLVESAKSACAAMSRWRIFRACCSGEIGIQIRASEVDFTKNPLNQIALEMKDRDMVIARLRERNEELQDANRQLQDANRQLQEEITNWKETVRILQEREGP